MCDWLVLVLCVRGDTYEYRIEKDRKNDTKMKTKTTHDNSDNNDDDDDQPFERTIGNTIACHNLRL